MWRSKLRHFLWREMSRVVALHNLASIRHLAGQQESLDEFAFAANREAVESLEPFSFRHFGFSPQPVCQKPKLFGRDSTPEDTVEQMVKQAGAEDCGGGCAAWLCAIKTAIDFIPQLLDFGWIVGINHALGQLGQLFAGQLAFARQFNRKLDHARLFRARQLLDFFNDGCGCHGKIVAPN